MSGQSRRRVLHVINGEFYAGAERVQDLLALRLGEFGYDVEFACLKDGEFDAKRQARDVELHRLPMRSRVDVGPCYRLARLLRDKKVRLVHTHTARSALIGAMAARLAGVPMVHHVHSPALRDTESGVRNARNAFVERWTLRRARRLIAVSSSLERQLREQGFGPDVVREVPNGVPTSEPHRRDQAPGQEFVIGAVALFRPRKGIEVLLEALARLRSAGVPARLHAVGPFETREYEQSVMQLARALGVESAVNWAGFRSDVAAEFARMHVFALPSLFGEGMPMVVLEAMAAGLPVVGTRVEGVPQVVRDGQDGLLVEPGDPDAFAAALQRFARGEVDARALGDSGRERQRRHFSDAAMAAGIASIYQEVLGQ